MMFMCPRLLSRADLKKSEPNAGWSVYWCKQKNTIASQLQKLIYLIILGERERERETCFLSLFMHFIQEISTKEIQTITDKFTYWTIDKKYWLSLTVHIIFVGKLLKQKLRSYFEDVCFVFFHPQTFILQ